MKAFNEQLAGKQSGDFFHVLMTEARKHSGLDRKAAAERIGLSPSHLGRIERGMVQMVNDPLTLTRAAHVYGVSDVWLYAGAAGSRKHIPAWYFLSAQQSTAGATA